MPGPRFGTALVGGRSTLVAQLGNDCVVDLGSTLNVPSLDAALRADLLRPSSWDELTGPRLDPAAIHFLPPVVAPSKVVCVGYNYRSHAEETSVAERVESFTDLSRPTLFLRIASAHVGHNEPVIKPDVSGYFDWEGELAVVIGIAGRHIARDEAMDHVFGYTPFADNSVRDWQFFGTQGTAGKNFDRSGSYGPFVAPKAVAGDPSALEVFTRLNGEQMQHGCLRDLVHGVPELISYISTFCTLNPGDVIATGTPSGIGARRTPPRYMDDGDVLEIDVPGVATLRNPVRSEQAVISSSNTVTGATVG